MSRLLINPAALRHNYVVIDRWLKGRGIAWTPVTKVLSGHEETLELLKRLGAPAIAESRLTNLEAVQRIAPDCERWFLRPPAPSECDDVVSLAEVSLNSEIEIIRSLDKAAASQNKVHRIIIMIELGDLREGVLPGSLVKFYKDVFELRNIEVQGIGANLGCLAGSVPTVDQYMQLILYRELLDLKFGHPLPFISAGSTATLPLLLGDQLPKGINHFRIGEALFLGTDLINGGVLPGLRDDVFILEGEILEIKKKSLVPLGETIASIAPFASNDAAQETTPGQRGYRALLDVGHLEADIAGLRPEDPDYEIAGASSDITVVNVGDNLNGLSVGDSIRFRLNYSALLRLMDSAFVRKEMRPDLSSGGATTPAVVADKGNGKGAAEAPSPGESGNGSGLTLEQKYDRDRLVWDACAGVYEERIVVGHPDVVAYMALEEDFLDRLLIHLARDRGLNLRLYDVGCGSGRLHVRYGLRIAREADLSRAEAERTRQARAVAQASFDPNLAERLISIGGLDFSTSMIELARRKIARVGLGSLLDQRLFLEQGSAFDLKPMDSEPVPVVVNVCNSIGVMQGEEGAASLFRAMRRAVEDAGGIAVISAYRKEAVESFALNNYESTLDVCGQPRWLVPDDYARSGCRLVARRWKRAFEAGDEVEVDVFDREGRLERRGLRLRRDPEAVREAIETGRIRTYSDYESYWHSDEAFEGWIRDLWGAAHSHHLAGADLDSLRGRPAQFAIYDPAGLLESFLQRWVGLETGAV